MCRNVYPYRRPFVKRQKISGLVLSIQVGTALVFFFWRRFFFGKKNERGDSRGHLGGDLNIFLNFYPLNGERFPFFDEYFSDGLNQATS